MNRKLLRQIAKEHGVTVEEVRRDMQAAIDATYQNPDRNLMNIKAQNAVPRKGEIPTVDEFVDYMAGEVRKKSHDY